MQVDAFTMPVDAFTMLVDTFTMLVDAFTMQVDAFTMQVDTFTMQVDAFTMPVDELQKLTLFFKLPNLKLGLTDRFFVAMGTLNIHYTTGYIYDYPRHNTPFASSSY